MSISKIAGVSEFQPSNCFPAITYLFSNIKTTNTRFDISVTKIIFLLAIKHTIIDSKKLNIINAVPEANPLARISFANAKLNGSEINNAKISLRLAKKFTVEVSILISKSNTQLFERH